MLLLSHLGPETIAEISLDEEDDEGGSDVQEASMVCFSTQCQATILGTVQGGPKYNVQQYVTSVFLLTTRQGEITT